MRSLVFVGLLAGCSFRLNAAGTGSAGSNGIDAAIDSATDGPPSANDMDGDGVPDNLDNCPTMANTDQRDHDIDGRGDVCDLCPHIAETTDTDTDGDGVGDACDPRPMTAGDHRALWVGFYDDNDIAGWTGNTTWTVSLGRLSGGDPGIGLAYFNPPAFQHAFMQTSVRIDALANPTGSVYPGAVIFNGNSGSPQYYQCEVAQPNQGQPQVYAVDPGRVDQKNWTGTLATNSEIMFTDDVLGGNHTCTAAQGSMAPVSITQGAGGTAGTSVLGSAYASVSYDYLFVVEIGT